jgi:colanic acid biosynthesis glycosyl transferase WcaI
LEIIQVNKSFSKNFYKRFFDEVLYSFILCYQIIKIRPNSLISSNCPLIPQLFVFILCKALKINFIFWLQDIISIAAKEILKKQKNPLMGFVSKIFFKIEFFILRNSKHIVTISEDFDDVLIKNNVEKSKISCIPNWSPINEIPLLNKNNSFSKKYNLDKSFNILYSGTLGFKHNPDVLIELSKFLDKKNINAKIVIVSEGEVVSYLKSESKKQSLNNFLFLPFQDFNLFPQVLASADISLVMLEKSAGQFSVPSKLLSILCSGRIPIVFVSKKNLTSRIVLRNNCGISVESQKDLNYAVSDVYHNFSKYEEMSANARIYAEKNFNIDNIVNKFQKIIR